MSRMDPHPAGDSRSAAAGASLAGPSPHPSRTKAVIVIFATLAAGVAALDLWSKQYVFQLLNVEIRKVVRDGQERPEVHFDRTIPVISGFFEIEPNVNTGAYSGWFSNHTQVLSALSVAALGIILWFLISHLRGSAPPRPWFAAALGLLFGGTLGNLYDRVAFGHVRDFIKWFVVWNGTPHVWPNFNVADSAICVGVAIILLVFLREPKPKPAGPAAS